MNGILLGLLLPFAGTALGAACVYLMRDAMPPRLQKSMLGFAAGVMVAASVWSLLIPAMDMSAPDGLARVWPAAIGFAAGIAFLLLLDRITPHQHLTDANSEGPRSHLSRTAKLALAVTLQNFPEGAIVSMPLRAAGNTRRRAFAIGVLSGAVEPVAAVVTMLLAAFIVPALPYLLAFAAGAMLYVVVEEIIPETQTGRHSDLGTVGFALGFLLMMLLDVVLG